MLTHETLSECSMLYVQYLIKQIKKHTYLDSVRLGEIILLLLRFFTTSNTYKNILFSHYTVYIDSNTIKNVKYV